jgi:hypothetical protein
MELIDAAKNGDIGRVHELLDSGIDPNIKNYDGNTPLIEASFYGHIYIVESLLRYDANPNIKNFFGYTPLINAILDGHTDIVGLLLDNDADPNIINNHGTALIEASRDGHTNIVGLLLDHGADPDIQEKYGKTALIEASYFGFIDIVELLLQHGADLDIRNNSGDTALTIAERRGHDIIARLIRYHIDLQRARQNLAFMKYFFDRDDLDIDTASRIFGNVQSYNPEVNIRMIDERRRDPLTKSKQRLATMRGIRDNHSVLQYLREPLLMENVDSYLTSMRPFPSVHSRMMLEDKKGGNKRCGKRSGKHRKNYTRKRY